MTTYVVQSGDTLYNIANRFNVSMDSIIAANNLADPNKIYIGMELKIPTAGGSQGNDDPSVTRRIGDLQYTIITDRRDYSRGQTVNLTLVKTNVSASSVTLRYSTAQRFDFAAFRNGSEVWRWSDNRSFAQVEGTRTLRPGESQIFRATWNLRNKQGNPVALDDFEIRGYNVAVGLRTRYVPITIRVVRDTTPTPGPTPSPGLCPSGNLLRNPDFSTWPGVNDPPTGWRGRNIDRIRSALSGPYAVLLGDATDREAELAQRVNALPRRTYQLTFYAREFLRGRGDFNLNAQIRYYDRNGSFIGRADPIFTQRSIPESYRQFSFTTELTPPGTARAEVLFEFFPNRRNQNPVAIDNVDFRCKG